MARTVLPLTLTLATAAACSSPSSPRPDVVSGPEVSSDRPAPDVPVVPDVALDAGVDVPIDRPPPPPDVSADATDAPPPPDRPAPDAGRTGPLFCDLAGPDVPGVRIPADLCLRRFARVPTPRVIVFAPNGDLFVASPSTGTPGGAPFGMGAILVLPDDNHDGVADSTLTYGTMGNVDGGGGVVELDSVHGLLFRRNELLFTVGDGVYSIPYATGERAMPRRLLTRIADLSDDSGANRWTHTLAESTTGTLYVSRGQYNETPVCPPRNARVGSVLSIGPGRDRHGDIVARGFRNPMYLRCQPWGACYAAELTGDGWPSDVAHEKLVQLSVGDDYGFPCCYDVARPVPGATGTFDCNAVRSSVQYFPLHDTPFGFDWDHGTWPAPYTNGFFVGLHGVVGSWTNTGIQWAPTDPTTHRPTRATVPLITGWGTRVGAPPGPAWGRVSDLLFAPDGRLFFTDDQDGAIYWMAPRTLRAPAR